MSPIDESLLSAFLDGELDPSSRLRVERAILQNPKLSRKLDDLARVRDLVAGLSRPGSSEWTAEHVLAAITEIDSRPSLWKRRPVRVLGLGLSLAAAAALWAFLVLGSDRIPPADGPALAHVPPSTSVDPTPTPSNPAPLPLPPPAAVTDVAHTPSPAPSPPAPTPPAPVSPSPTLVAEAPPPPADDRLESFLKRYAEGTAAFEVVIALADPGPEALADIEKLVASTPRQDPEYARFEATRESGGLVFLLPADEVELTLLLDELRQRFGRRFSPVRRPQGPPQGPELAALGPASLVDGTLAAPRVETDTAIVAHRVSPFLPSPPVAPPRPAPRPNASPRRLAVTLRVPLPSSLNP